VRRKGFRRFKCREPEPWDRFVSQVYG